MPPSAAYNTRPYGRVFFLYLRYGRGGAGAGRQQEEARATGCAMCGTLLLGGNSLHRSSGGCVFLCLRHGHNRLRSAREVASWWQQPAPSRRGLCFFARGSARVVELVETTRTADMPRSAARYEESGATGCAKGGESRLLMATACAAPVGAMLFLYGQSRLFCLTGRGSCDIL